MDIEKLKEMEEKTDFVVSWFAKKYNKTIFRVGNLNHEGCRVWEQGRQKVYVFLGHSIRTIYNLHKPNDNL